MSKPKYKQGKLIKSISDFDKNTSKFYRVDFGERTRTLHRSFLISWSYRTLKNFIDRGCIHEAEMTEEEKRFQRLLHGEIV